MVCLLKSARLSAMLLGICLVLNTPLQAKEVKVLLVAISGVDEGVQEWQPTLDEIQKSVPEHTFRLIPVIPKELDRIKALIANGEVDFVITQPAIYVDLELSYGISRILTLEKQKGVSEFGSVLITKNDSAIKSLADIRGKKVAGVAKMGFGGWLVGYHEMLESGVDPYKEADEVLFLGTQTNVLDAVLSGDADLGVIRTGIVEKAYADNTLQLADIRVINAKEYEHFPQLVSTGLFPEWAFARTKCATNDLANKVAHAMLDIPQGGEVARQGRYWRWTLPYDYQTVHELMQHLQVGPYKEYGKITLSNFVSQYRYSVTLFLLLSTIILIMSTVIYRSNRVLLKEKEEKEKLLSSMEYMAKHDDLTRLPNRRLFFEILRQILQKSNRDGSMNALLFMDLDGFKEINDQFGHTLGDQALKRAAGVLQGCVRQSDVVARIGGDEFVAVLQDIKSVENAQKVMDEIIGQVPSSVDFLESKTVLGVSIGCLICGPKQLDVDELVKSADELMYRAKAAGKGCYVIKDLSVSMPMQAKEGF